MNLKRPIGRVIRKLQRTFGYNQPDVIRTRPFTHNDFLPLPDKTYKICPPDFVGIASGKAGTSWWYSLLQRHPAVKPNRLARKELAYFPHFGYHGIPDEAIATYRQAFARPEGCICGEWSPGYLTFPLAIEYLAKSAPRTRILISVRNPVDRIVSAINQRLSVQIRVLKLTGKRTSIFQTYNAFPLAMIGGFLYSSVQQLFQVFDRSQVLVLQYEKCVLETRVELAKTYRFLGIDETYVPSDITRKVNIHPYRIPKPSPEERVRLARYFEDDVYALAELLPEIDLSLWPDFAQL